MFMNYWFILECRFVIVILVLIDVKVMVKLLGVMINDMVLVMLIGVLCILLLCYDGKVELLLVLVLVSYDFLLEWIFGNCFIGMLVVLFVDFDDLLQWVCVCYENVVFVKESYQFLGLELISCWVVYWLFVGVEVLFWWLFECDGQNKVFNLNILNVFGLCECGCVGVVLVIEIYLVGLLIVGSGLNIMVWSYVDQFNILVLIDGFIVQDLYEVIVGMIVDFIEICCVVGFFVELIVVEFVMVQV